MSNTVLLTLWSDPGHAWLEVPPETLDFVMPRAYVSHYSHYGKRDGSPAFFLEEDCDLALFLAAAQTSGLTVEIEDRRDVGECIRRTPQWEGCRLDTFEYRAQVRSAVQILNGKAASGLPLNDRSIEP